MWHKNGDAPTGDGSDSRRQIPKTNRRYAGKNPMPEKKDRESEVKKFLKTHPAGHSTSLNRDVDRRSYDQQAPEVGPGIAPNSLSQQILVYHESEPAEAGND